MLAQPLHAAVPGVPSSPSRRCPLCPLYSAQYAVWVLTPKNSCNCQPTAPTKPHNSRRLYGIECSRLCSSDLFPPSMGLLLLLLPLSAGSAAAAAAAAATTWRLARAGEADASHSCQLLLHGAESCACRSSRVLSCCAALCLLLHPSCGHLVPPPALARVLPQVRWWWCLAVRGCAAWLPVANILPDCSADCAARPTAVPWLEDKAQISCVFLRWKRARGQPNENQNDSETVTVVFCALISAKCSVFLGAAAAVQSAFLQPRSWAPEHASSLCVCGSNFFQRIPLAPGFSNRRQPGKVFGSSAEKTGQLQTPHSMAPSKL